SLFTECDWTGNCTRSIHQSLIRCAMRDKLTVGIEALRIQYKVSHQVNVTASRSLLTEYNCIGFPVQAPSVRTYFASLHRTSRWWDRGTSHLIPHQETVIASRSPVLATVGLSPTSIAATPHLALA